VCACFVGSRAHAGRGGTHAFRRRCRLPAGAIPGHCALCPMIPSCTCIALRRPISRDRAHGSALCSPAQCDRARCPCLCQAGCDARSDAARGLTRSLSHADSLERLEQPCRSCSELTCRLSRDEVSRLRFLSTRRRPHGGAAHTRSRRLNRRLWARCSSFVIKPGHRPDVEIRQTLKPGAV